MFAEHDSTVSVY